MKHRIYKKINNLIRDRYSDYMGNHLFVEYPKCGATWISNMFAASVEKEKITNHEKLFFNKVYQDHILNTHDIHNTTIVFRDPRDVLVSYYYYDCNVLNNDVPNIIGYDGKFSTASFEKYVKLRVENPTAIYPYFTYLSFYESWMVNEHDKFVRYEDFKDDTYLCLKKLCENNGYNIGSEKLIEVINKHDFNKVAKRKPGDADPKSHKRKGIVGDWKNHFNQELNEYVYDKWEKMFSTLGYTYE